MLTLNLVCKGKSYELTGFLRMPYSQVPYTPTLMPHPEDADLCRIVCPACPPYGRAYRVTVFAGFLAEAILRGLMHPPEYQ